MKKYAVLSIVGLVVLAVIIVVLLNPLRRSKEHIRNGLLKMTPVGTSMDDVLVAIESSRKWKYYTSNSHSWPLESKEITSEYIDSFIRTKSMIFYLGKYGFFTVCVSAKYTFDEDLNLIDVVVDKENGWP